MLRIQTDLRAYAIAAGEAWLMETQLLDQNSQALDIPDDALVLTFYDAGTRAIVDQTIGERRQDSTGEYFRWARPGTFTESLYGKALKVELARRYKDSRLVIATGDLTISSTAASVPSLSTAPIGDIITRISIKASAQLGGTPTIAIALRPFEEAPIFSERPSIQHDGTPTVGETGTLAWGEISGGSSILRQVLLDDEALTSPIGATILFQAGTYRLREVAEGPGGRTESFSDLVEVVAAITAPAKVGDLPHIYRSVGSGPHPFSIASGFSGEDLVFSVEEAPAGAEYALDPLTGTGILQTDAVADGNMRVRATNAAGYAEQTFPYFIRAEATFTVLAREPNGTVTVESFAEVTPLTTTRNVDGSVTVQEAA